MPTFFATFLSSFALCLSPDGKVISSHSGWWYVGRKGESVSHVFRGFVFVPVRGWYLENARSTRPLAAFGADPDSRFV